MPVNRNSNAKPIQRTKELDDLFAFLAVQVMTDKEKLQAKAFFEHIKNESIKNQNPEQ